VTTPVFIHVLSLDTIGGVETLYVNFIEKALAAQDAAHVTSVCGKRPHADFATRFSAIRHEPFLEEHVMAVRLPRLLRGLVNIRRGMIQEIANPTSWVFWNRIEQSTPVGHAVYYEHGAAWNVSPTKKRTHFLQHCSRTIANSHAAVLILKEKWGVQNDVTVVPNPLRPDISFVPEARPFIRSGPLRLGFIGRLVSVKGLGVAIHTLKILRDRGIDALLSIAGIGPLEKKGRRLAELMGVASSIQWKGNVSPVANFYDAIDILLVPSIREPLGLVSLEAAARGVPAIAAAVDGIPEAVLDGTTGLCLPPTIERTAFRDLLVVPHELPEVVVNPVKKCLQEPKIVDPRDMANAAEMLINNPLVYSQFSRNAIDYAHTRSDFDSYFNSLKLLFEPHVATHAPETTMLDTVDGVMPDTAKGSSLGEKGITPTQPSSSVESGYNVAT
jgi:glycosyltransferase involved in cell wall biosynthesis